MSEIYHVLPVGDEKEHVQSKDCACGPRIENNLVIHNAYDNREFDEIADEINDEN